MTTHGTERGYLGRVVKVGDTLSFSRGPERGAHVKILKINPITKSIDLMIDGRVQEVAEGRSIFFSTLGSVVDLRLNKVEQSAAKLVIGAPKSILITRGHEPPSRRNTA